MNYYMNYLTPHSISLLISFVFSFLVFMLGASIGSFILLIADRYNTGASFLRGRSVCFNCSTVIGFFELIPIFSFIFLRGKCKHCDSKLSIYYILVEIIMGLLALIVVCELGINILNVTGIHFVYFLFALSIFAVFLLITIYDLRHFIIPDTFLFFLIFLSIIKLIVTGHPLNNIVAAIIIPLPFLIIWLVSRGKWLGFGDVKYMAVIGLLLGIPIGVSAVVVAFWIGALFAVAAMIAEFGVRNYKTILYKYFGKKTTKKNSAKLLKKDKNFTMKTAIPFGPFLSLGTLIAFCFSLDIFSLNSIFNVLFN